MSRLPDLLRQRLGLPADEHEGETELRHGPGQLDHAARDALQLLGRDHCVIRPDHVLMVSPIGELLVVSRTAGTC